MNDSTPSHTSSVKIEPSWGKVLAPEFEKAYFKQLVAFLKQEKQKGVVIYPPGSQIFRAFELTPFDSVNVVLIGQDPYHNPKQAHGLCFSVPYGVKAPPSLENVFKEMQSDLGLEIPKHGNLESWAMQGVLLLNAILTVKAGQAASHHKMGWEQFTDAVIARLNDQKSGIIFILWGKYAQAKGKIIDTARHYVLTAAHPSPLGVHAGFFGCRHFSRTNELLMAQGKKPIDWKLPPLPSEYKKS